MNFANMITSGLISNSVGNNLVNEEEDVMRVKDGLSRLGLFDNETTPEPHGYITRPMDEGIKTFQERESLRIDGRLFPNGETENAMLRQLSETQTPEEDNVPTPPHKPEAPQEEKPQDEEGGKRDYGQRGEGEREEWRQARCNDLWRARAKAKEEIERIRNEKEQKNQELAQKRSELEKLQAEMNGQQAKSIPTPSRPSKDVKGRIGVVLEVITAGLNVRDLYDMGKKVEGLEAEIEKLEDDVERLTLKEDEQHENLNNVSAQLETLGCEY